VHRSIRRPDLAPIAVLSVAFALRIAGLTGESLWRDEVDTVRFAFLPLSGILSNFAANGFNGPLYHLLIRVWLSLVGVSDLGLRLFSLGCGVVLVALIYPLGCRLFGRRAAVIAMWLAGISPVLTWYSGEGKMYALQPMLLTLALYALVRAVTAHGRTGSRPWWLVFITSTSLSFYVQLLSPLFLPVALAFFVALWPNARHHIAGGLIALVALTVPYIPMAIWQVPAFLQGGDIGHAFYPLGVIGLTLASNWTLGLDGRAPLLNLPASDGEIALARMASIALCVVLAAYGLIDAVSQARSRPEERRRVGLNLATLFWLAAPTLLIYVIAMRIPIFQPRYVLWCAPALYLLVGFGVARLRGEAGVGRVAGTLIVGMISLISVSGWVSQVANPIRPDLRSASRYVADAVQPGDAVVFQIPYGRFGFEYYAARLGRSLDGVRLIEAPFTNSGMTEDEVAAALAPVLGPARRIWLYETESTMWDARGLVRARMDRDFVAVDRREFRGVSIGLYEVPTSRVTVRPVAWLRRSV
jgi:mannosyltransferase